MTYIKPSTANHSFGVLFLFIATFLMFWDVLLPFHSRILSDGRADLAIHFIWWRKFGFDQLRGGNFPLWNPHFLCGNPFFGGFQSGLLYPPNWIHLILPLPFSLNLEIFLDVFLAGFFTYLWSWNRGLKPLACAMAGMAFMFGGGFFLHLFPGHLPNLAAMVWAPVIFLSLDRTLQRPGIGSVLLGIFAVSMQIFAGHPQYFLFTAIISIFYMGFGMVGIQGRMRALGNFFLIYLGASMVAAVQLWTGLHAFLECSRDAPMDFRSAASFFFPPQNILTAILPEFFGDPQKGHYWSQWYFWEGSIFVGCSTVILALLTLGRGSEKEPRALWACATISLLFAFGVHTPLYQLLYEYVPWFNGMRGIGKFSFLTGLFLALLCGIGMDRLMRFWVLPKGWVLGTFLLGCVFCFLGAGILFSGGEGFDGIWGRALMSLPWLKGTWHGLDGSILGTLVKMTSEDSSRSLLVGGALFISIAVVLMFHSVLKGYTAILLATFVVFELSNFAGSYRPTFDPGPSWSKAASLRDLYQKVPGDYRVFGTGAAALGIGGFDIWEDEPMVLGRYGRFIARTQGIREEDLFSTSPLFKILPDLYGMLRLRYRIVWGEDLLRVQPMEFKTLPRMYLSRDWEIFSEESRVLDRIVMPGFDPFRKVLLEQDPGIVHGKGDLQGRVTWKDLDTDRIEVWADVPQPSLLVVTDNYSKGWKAIGADGKSRKEYPVIPGNGFLRVVPLAPGLHHFLLVYEPWAFRVGMWVSLLSLLFYVAILLNFLIKNNSFRPKPT